MVYDMICTHCGESFPGSERLCPHCGKATRFTPNVNAANRPVEKDALKDRYEKACILLSKNKCETVRRKFETDIQKKSKAVLCVWFAELQRIANADNQVFSTYYQRISAGLEIPKGGKWDVLRGVAEHALFPGYKDNIRFAALSLNKLGVSNYGDCAITLKERMIAHRTSVFEDNNVVFTVYEQQTSMADADHLEPGHRATWKDRHKLCVAKLAPELKPHYSSPEFAELLIRHGRTTRDDRFVELHIWGSITVKGVEHVVVRRRCKRPPMVSIKDIRRILAPRIKVDIE